MKCKGFLFPLAIRREIKKGPSMLEITATIFPQMHESRLEAPSHAPPLCQARPDGPNQRKAAVKGSWWVNFRPKRRSFARNENIELLRSRVWIGRDRGTEVRVEVRKEWRKERRKWRKNGRREGRRERELDETEERRKEWKVGQVIRHWRQRKNGFYWLSMFKSTFQFRIAEARKQGRYNKFQRDFKRYFKRVTYHHMSPLHPRLHTQGNTDTFNNRY